MSLFGEALLVAVFLLCCFVVIFGLLALKLETETARRILSVLRRLTVIGAGLWAVALIVLAVAFVSDDFSLAAVARHSSVSLPFIYKLSALWASSAGLLAVWSSGVFLCFVPGLAKTAKEDIRLFGTSVVLGAFVCLGFAGLLVFVEKPFAGCLVTVDNGAGLNPLLRNFWMIIHPPLLFIGYSAFLVPFVAALAAVFTGRTENPDIYRFLRHWLLVGICFLGLGILTGSRWSYMELGWGGYWTWDTLWRMHRFCPGSWRLQPYTASPAYRQRRDLSAGRLS